MSPPASRVLWVWGPAVVLMVLILMITTAYGLTDEFHQRFVPGRTADVRDLAADTIGALFGILLVWACSIVLATRRHP